MKVLRRKRAIILVALFLTYASFFLCRSNVDAALPLLSKAYGYDKVELGRLSSLAILGYAVGKVSLGPLGDLVGGRRLMLVSILGSALASLGFGMSTSVAALTVLAVVNRWFQSGGWAGLVHVSSREFVSTEHGSVMGTLSTSYEIGSALSLLFCGLLVEVGLSWRALFIVNPILMATVGFATTRVLRRATLSRDDTGTRRAEPLETGGAEEGAIRRAAWLASLRPFWIALSLSFLLTFVRTGFLTWTPTFLAEVTAKEGGSLSGAILKSAIFPATGVAGALLAGRASDRWGPGRRAPVIAGSLCLLVISILALAHAGLGGTTSILACLATSGFFLLGPYSLVGGAIALDVGKTRAAATAAGLIDAAGYVGGSLAGVLLGTLAERRGWSAAFDALAVAAFVASLVAAAWSFSLAVAVRSKAAL